MISPVDPLSQSATQATTLASVSAPVEQVQQVQPAPRPSDAFDAERFSRLMEAGKTEEAPRIDACAPGDSKSDCLGDKVLTQLSSMSEEFNKTWSEVADVVSGPENSLSLQDMLKAQLHLVRVAAEYETIGKAIGKSTQNVDQMIRMQ